ncbi:hypothetical protein JX266_012982 [Neoarthrinium moseri]|nr:hypothetical protein JX266_012982 [Neoarthrinium moseri]
MSFGAKVYLFSIFTKATVRHLPRSKMEHVVQPTVIPPTNYIASQVTLNFVAACFITVRLGANWSHHKKFFADDFLCIVALLLVVSYSLTSSMMVKTFNSDPKTVSITFITNLAAACIFTATAAMYFAKLPILVLILRTFHVKKWLRYISYTLMSVTAVGFLASALWTGVHCSPGLHRQDQQFLFGCVEATFYTTVSRNSLSLVVDLVIFVLPLPLIMKLKLPRNKKLGVAVIFLTGSFGITAGIVSLYYQAGQAAETSSNITNAMLATVTECCIIISVSCAAGLRLLWTQHIRDSALLSWVAEARRSTASQSYAAGSQKQHSKSSTTPIKVTNDYYVELQDGPIPYVKGFEADGSGNSPQHQA